MGLLDGTYTGLDPYSGLLSPQQQQALGMQQLIATMGAIGAASRPSRLPVGLGAAMGQGAVAGEQAQQQGALRMLQTGLLGQEVQKNTLQNRMLQQRYSMLQDALNGTGAFGTASSPLAGNGSAAGSGAAPASEEAPGGGGILSGAPVSGGAGVGGIPVGLYRQALISDALVPGSGKGIIDKQFPGPTDFMRAYQDFVSAPAPLKPLALQKLTTAAGDRYQLMRNGWAYDRVLNQWMHMPELGEGVTGTMGPNGQISASIVPGELPALAATSKARASGAASFEPFTTYDQNGNEIIRPRTALAGGAPAPAPTTNAPAPPPGMSYGGAAGVGSVAAPTPATISGQPKPIPSLTLNDVVPPGAMIPSRPAAPAGAFLGKPNAGTVDMQKNDADRLAKYQNQAAEGQKIYQDLQMLSGTLERGLNTNELAPAFTKLANIAQGMGLSSLIPKNYDPNDAGEFAKVATDLTFAALKQIPGQPRVAEIEGLQRANPNMTLPPATNVAILHAILANQQWMDKRAELGTQFMAQHPGAPLGYFDAQFNKTAPLADATAQVFDAARKAGWQFPGDKGLPSNPASSPSTFANDKRALTIRENYQKGMYGKVGSPEAKAAAEKAYRAIQ